MFYTQYSTKGVDLMKKITAAVLCIALCLTLFVPVFAAETSGTCGASVNWSYDAVSKTLTLSGTGEMTNYKDVVSIPWKVYCKEIQKIEIGTGITSIGDYSLSWCENVTSVVIPPSVTRIGVDAFGWCSSLRDVTLPDGLLSIEREAFALCSSLETIDIPASVTNIGSMAFLSCYGLKDINVNAGNTKYRSFDGVLYDVQSSTLVCYPLGKSAETFTVPENIINIGPSAFSGNEVLKTVEMPSVKKIGNKAFFTCSALYNVVMNSVEIIEDLAFYRCSDIVSVSLPESAVSLGSEVFRNCANLQLVMLANNNIAIGSNILGGAPYAAIVANNYSTGQMYAYNCGIPFYGFVKVYYDGEAVAYDPTAFIVNDSTTLVPMRQVFEMLNADVSWNDATNTAGAVRGGVAVSIQIGSGTMYRNGQAIDLPVPGQLIADKTYVPLRAVTEAFGNQVGWDENTNSVYITSN